MKRASLFMLLLLSAFWGTAQTRTLTGVITNVAGSPIENATIQIMPGKTLIQTDAKGEFTIQAKVNTVLYISAVGYDAKRVKPIGTKFLRITLQGNYANLGMVTVGSRGKNLRSSIESTVPIDILKTDQIASTTGRANLEEQLMLAVPSFNFNKQDGSDGADAVDFASMRGLGYDATLVLINGKRRHNSAYVGAAGAGIDMNAIPQEAIDHIEILRDGASAQYGSDAIAGVINIIMKKEPSRFNISTGVSGYYDHKYNTLNAVDPSQFYTGSRIDGKTFTFAFDKGYKISKNGGSLVISGNFLSTGKTFRAEPDTNVTTNSEALPISTWRRAAGTGSVITAGGMYNLELPLKGDTKFYAFGGYNYKHSNVYAWTRNWSSAKTKFPTDEDGNLIFVAGIMRLKGSSVLDANNVYYNPQEDVYLQDVSNALGIKGTWGAWSWDVSNNTGFNDYHFWGNKTFNATLPLPEQYTKTRFNDGGFDFLQNTTNFDISKRYGSQDVGLTLAAGAEFRYERYKLYAGEPDSYRNGGATLADGSAKVPGSEGYPGYRPTDATNDNRTNISGYVDAAWDISKAWLVDAAARFENYSDFGFVNVYKLASRLKLSETFNLRGSISTGFRAPSLQQIDYSNTNTTVGSDHLLHLTKIIPNYADITREVGIPKLKQETSINTSIGFAWKIIPELTATVDGYMVKMKNRIILTGNFDSTISVLKDYLDENNISAAQFYANAVNTTNTGLDIVLDFHKYWGKSHFTALFTGNFQHITINKVNIPSALNGTYATQQAFFSSQAQAKLKSYAPNSKLGLNLEYGEGIASIGTHLTYWGKITHMGNGSATVSGAAAGGPGGDGISNSGNGWDPYVELDDGSGVVPETIVFRGKITTDVFGKLKLAKNVNWVLGIDNLFNVHPDAAYTKGAKLNSFGDNETGGTFDSVQMGYNGLRIYSQFQFSF